MNTELSWKIISSYFKDHHLERLVRHQLESYNKFISEDLFNTIEMFNPVNIHSEHDKDPTSGKYKLEIIITFSNLQLYRPQIHENNGATKIMFPHEARLRNFTYSSPMTVNINIKINRRYGEDLKNMETFNKVLKNIHIGKIPIMLKSNICVLKQYFHLKTDLVGECKFDPGGYFVISGSEKTVLAQERAAENQVMCFNIVKNNNKWKWLAEVKSIPRNKCISPKQINMYIATKNNGSGHPIYVQIPRIKNPIPLFVLFRALGILSDKEICEIIVLNIEDDKMKRMVFGLKASIIDSNKYLSKESLYRIYSI